MDNVLEFKRNDPKQELIDFIKDEDYDKMIVVGFSSDDENPVWGTSQYGDVNNSDIVWYATKLIHRVHE